MKTQKDDKTEQIALFLSYILMIGVTLSAFLIFIGMVLVHSHPAGNFNGFFVTLREGIKQGGYFFLVIGFLLLLATPIMRVLFSLILFLLAKDWTYTFITMIVMFILVASLILGTLQGKVFAP